MHISVRERASALAREIQILKSLRGRNAKMTINYAFVYMNPLRVELILLDFYRNWYAYDNSSDDDDATDRVTNARIQINFSIELTQTRPG